MFDLDFDFGTKFTSLIFFGEPKFPDFKKLLKK